MIRSHTDTHWYRHLGTCTWIFFHDLAAIFTTKLTITKMLQFPEIWVPPPMEVSLIETKWSLCQKWSILLEHSDFPFRCIHWILSFKSQIFWSTGALCLISWLQLTLKQTLTCAVFSLPQNYCNDLDFALTAPSVSRTVYQGHTQTQHHSFRCEEYWILILRHVC